MFGGEIGFLRLGDKVEGGGEVISASGTGWMINGRPAAVLGDLARCDTHNGEFPLVEGYPDFTIDGKPAAFDRYRLACGCRVLSSCNGSWGLGKAEPVRYADAFSAGRATPLGTEPTRFAGSGVPTSTAVILRIGLFADGTGNNMGNTAYAQACLVREADARAALRHHCNPELLGQISYKNDITNVARLYGLYRRTVSLANAPTNRQGQKVAYLKLYAPSRRGTLASDVPLPAHKEATDAAGWLPPSKEV